MENNTFDLLKATTSVIIYSDSSVRKTVILVLGSEVLL